MIPTDSASLRARTLLNEAAKTTKPLRVFCGFVSGRGGERRLACTLHGTRLVKGLPRREFAITTALDAEHLQGMIEDAWLGLVRDFDTQAVKRPATAPERRHGWRATITGDCINAKVRA